MVDTIKKSAERNHSIIEDKSDAYEKHAKGKISPQDFRIALSIYKDEILGTNFLDSLLYKKINEEGWDSRVVIHHIPLEWITSFVHDLKEADGQQIEDVAHYISERQETETELHRIRTTIAGYDKDKNTLKDIMNDDENELWFEQTKDLETNNNSLNKFAKLMNEHTGKNIPTDWLFDYVRQSVSQSIYSSALDAIQEVWWQVDAKKQKEVATYISDHFNETHEHNLTFAILNAMTQAISKREPSDRKAIMDINPESGQDYLTAIRQSPSVQKILPGVSNQNTSPIWTNIKKTMEYVSKDIVDQELYDSDIHGEIVLYSWPGEKSNKAKKIVKDKNELIWANTESFNVLFNDINTTTYLIETCIGEWDNYDPSVIIKWLVNAPKGSWVKELQEKSKKINIEPDEALIQKMNESINDITTDTQKANVANWITWMKVEWAARKINDVIDGLVDHETYWPILEFMGINKESMVSYLDPTEGTRFAKFVRMFLGLILKNKWIKGITTLDLYNNLRKSDKKLITKAQAKETEYEEQLWSEWWDDLKITETWQDNKIEASVYQNYKLNTARAENILWIPLAKKISLDIKPSLILKAYDNKPNYPTEFLEEYINEDKDEDNKIPTINLMTEAKKVSKEVLMETFLNRKVNKITTTESPLTKDRTAENPLTADLVMTAIFEELEYGDKQQKDMLTSGKWDHRLLTTKENVASVSFSDKEKKENTIYYIDPKSGDKIIYNAEIWIPRKKWAVVLYLVPKTNLSNIRKDRISTTIYADPNFRAAIKKIEPWATETTAPWTTNQTVPKSDDKKEKTYNKDK